MARSANDHLGGATEGQNIKKIVKNAKLYMTVVMAVHKRYTASGRALRVESAASEIQHVKIYLRQTLQYRNKYMHERRFAVMNLLHLHYRSRRYNLIFIT